MKSFAAPEWELFYAMDQLERDWQITAPFP